VFGIHYGFLKQFGGGFTGFLGIKTALDLISTHH
jgi:hypothetical protein